MAVMGALCAASVRELSEKLNVCPLLRLQNLSAHGALLPYAE